ncbi:MAG: glycosyltransferase family 2 protein [Nitrospiraceae bacterium]
MLLILSITLGVVACLLTISVGYLIGLAGVYYFVNEKPIPRVPPVKRFAVLIPAHNEEVIIEEAIRSWHRVEYPKDLVRIHVIADNCTDRTVAIAQRLGVNVSERHDLEHGGKGQALAWALQNVDLAEIDAAVIVDADTTVDKEFLSVMNDRFVAGARVVQGYDGVMNPHESAMTCLMQITNVMKNLLFNYAKSKVGLSVHLMGTGMCIATDVLKGVGWRAFSIGEDIEQSAFLAKAGIHVEFDPRAHVFAQEASSLGQAYTQRVRWAAGRMQLLGTGARLFCDGVRTGNLQLADSGVTFLLPNYAMLANMTIGGLLLASLIEIPGRHMLLLWFAILLVAQCFYLFLGLLTTRPTPKMVWSLAFAPIFLIWKLMVDLISVLHLNESKWVRTRRSSPGGKEDPPATSS